MQFTDFLRAIGKHATSVPGLKFVYYPMPSKITDTPALVVLSSGPSTILHIDHEGPGEQMWSGQVLLQLLVAPKNDVEAPVLAHDALIFPLTDAFSIDGDGIGVEFPELDVHIDRCVVTDWRTNEALTYAGHTYVGADITLDFKFHRVWQEQ